MELPLPVYLIGLRGLLVLLVLLLLGISFFVNLPLLLREPAPWQIRFFRLTAGAAVVAFVAELLVRTFFMGGVGRLHAVYGLLATSILWFVSGLGEGGWFRRSLTRPPERVGPYFFWASLVGVLLWWRFIETGIGR
ncbi:MAG: hypothetical protein NZ849_08220 [Meiothermus sp.]|uniref:hypothetical protein n=1 Tax=Meiothermus sp. TaxID=1955249 RepID=UPI0025E13C31|nr:hypothetical protein [Meiothermus sp.]MCS7057300.1 hypothetical protein [Meiothermus sp.]MCS7194877.1 hypothetical protein [Meiothermus sp.]MCX7739511.1 hypothetical protein [Meiothermus sp.]MDW8091269.1 hypothetical protein [Meiothermus sp.]MDW8480387.1 hypothetical protein [Meiothermus sp.]